MEHWFQCSNLMNPAPWVLSAKMSWHGCTAWFSSLIQFLIGKSPARSRLSTASQMDLRNAYAKVNVSAYIAEEALAALPSQPRAR